MKENPPKALQEKGAALYFLVSSYWGPFPGLNCKVKSGEKRKKKRHWTALKASTRRACRCAVAMKPPSTCFFFFPRRSNAKPWGSAPNPALAVRQPAGGKAPPTSSPERIADLRASSSGPRPVPLGSAPRGASGEGAAASGPVLDPLRTARPRWAAFWGAPITTRLPALRAQAEDSPG